MIIKRGIVKIKREPRISIYEDGNFQIYYKGLIYIDHKKFGEETLKEIIKDYELQNSFNFDVIKGNYCIYFIDKRKNFKYFFIDNSGIFKAFIYKDTISTSFLELIDFVRFNPHDLNYRAITEFLHFGHIHFGETFVSDVCQVNKNEYIVFNDKGHKENREKRLKTIDVPISLNLEKYFKSLLEAIERKKISLDLTGGIDSRLIAVAMNYFGGHFELAISGVEGNQDIKIAEKISQILGKDFFPTYHAATGLSESDLYSIFNVSDSLIDILSFHRNYQLHRDRQKRKIEIQISGAGGELFKDFWWLQDFPFYAKRVCNLNRLYDLRIESVKYPHQILGERIRSLSLALKQNIIDRLCSFRMFYNTQTYDNIYYNYKMPAMAGSYITLANKFFVSYAPFLELDLVRFGFCLKRKQRFYNNFHRQMISKFNPCVAKIKTTESVTCCSCSIHKTKDLFCYLFDMEKRLLKQVFRKLFKKTYFQESPENKEIVEIVRRLPLIQRVEQNLKNYQILNKDIDLAKLDGSHIGKFLTVGMLLEHI